MEGLVLSSDRTDGWILLDALQAPCAPDWLQALPAVATLRTMWDQQFEVREQGGQWRKEPVLPATQLIASPYDLRSKLIGIKPRPALISPVSLFAWETETVTCPQGQVNSSWTPIQREGKSLIQVRFSQTDCKACPSRTSCTGTTRRTLTLHSKEQTQALLAACKREHTDAFKDTYRHRAGIEGTHSQVVSAMGLRRSLSIGLRKTHLGHIEVAAATNLVRLTSFLRGEAPEQTRISAFKQVMKPAG